MEKEHWLSRTELLIGEENIRKLQNAHVLIAGLGGVGGYAAEAVTRAGVGSITIVDNDVITPTNRNRQLIALVSDEGKAKAEVMRHRLLNINEDLNIRVLAHYLIEDTIKQTLSGEYDYVIDAIDTLSPKVHFIKESLGKGFRLVSSLGAGGRLDPSQIHVTDISKTYNCTFARALRKRLHREGIDTGFQAVFSTEPVIKSSVVVTPNERNKKSMVGTISYLPAIFGLMAASVAIRGIIEQDDIS